MYKEKKYRTKINGKRTFLYNCYINMMARCYNSNHPTYPSYGGRGIKVDPHLQKFTNFVDHMYELLPEGYTMEDIKRLKMSLNRINNDGNYEPGNLEWETKKGQVLNRNIPKSNKSGYLGVFWVEGRGKWEAQISIDDKTKHLGYFDLPEPEKGFDAYQKAYLEAHGPETHAKMMNRQLERCKERGLKLIDPVTGVCYDFKNGAENETNSTRH
jgi:hypothetical protein